MRNEQALEHVQKTFSAGTVPKNVTTGNAFARRRVLRRFTRFALGSNLFSAVGSFDYRTGTGKKRIEFNGRNLQFRAVYDEHYRHGYEIETALLVAHLCGDEKSFWDVGANWGYFSLLAASLPDFQGGVEAFEPNPRTFQDLRSTVAQAGLDARIHCHNLGAGSRNCEMTVTESDRFNSGLSQLTHEGGGDKIPVTTLDDFPAPPPGFVKIDAEGMELDILKGAARLLREARPFLLFENFTDQKAPASTYEPMEFLEAQDYKVFIPFLRFNFNRRNVAATYGSDYNSLFAQDPQPALRLVELRLENRFLFASQLNLLAVHAARAPELSARGLLEPATK
jgi:FkbM family methyltransferase